MRAAVLLALLGACSTPAPPRSDHGTLLYADADEWVVQHDDPLYRTVQGVEVYRAPPVAPDDLQPGSHVDLWIDRVPENPGLIQRAAVTGHDALPPNHIDGGSPLRGVVVRADATKLLVDHEPIEGVMPAMVMPFVASSDATKTVRSGDTLTGRIVASAYGYALVDVEKDASAPVLAEPVAAQAEPLAVGELLGPHHLDGHDGSELLVGSGQGASTVLAFVYTTCPDPAFCPATVTRLQGLQRELPDGARIVAVTIDPEHDTVDVLRDYAGLSGAAAGQWWFARPSPTELHTLAVAAGLTVSVRSGRISHSTRLLVLDAQGHLVARYDDNDFPQQQVLDQLAGREATAD